MATKRDLESIADPAGDNDTSSPAPSSKRARNNNNSDQRKQNKQQSEAATDVTYGQRYCFSSMQEAMSDEDLEFEDETDALAYLQSVRHEASAIPHLLVAPKSGPELPPTYHTTSTTTTTSATDDDDDTPVDRSIYTTLPTDASDARGYYSNGAYTAAPSALPRSPSPAAPPLDTAYFTTLTSSFARLRSTLHQTPPPPTTPTDPEHTPFVGTFGPRSRTFAVWTARLLNTDPRPTQVAAMDKGAVLRLLRVVLGGKFLRTGGEVSERTSRWLWALLARLPDRGEMDHVEVGHVRELGKRAALLMHSLKEMAALREEVELAGHGGVGDEEVWVGVGGEDDDDGDEDGEPRAEDGEQEELKPAPNEANTRHDTPMHPPTNAPDAPDAPNKPISTPTTTTAPTAADDSDLEDGEIADDSEAMDLSDDDENIQSAKARLLANLEQAGTEEEEEAEKDKHDDAVRLRARMNMRATLNMILTVAGEFYGQRDLLEFRDPFHGI